MQNKFFEEFHVEGRLLKLLFLDLKLIFKNTTYSKTIKFTTKDNCLIAEVMTSAYYKAVIPVVDNVKDGLELSCLYKDLSDLIPAKENIKLSFVATYLGVQTDEVYATLSKSLYKVVGLDISDNKSVTIETRNILPGIKWLLSLSAYTNAYPGNNKIVFNDDYMQIAYSTLRVECVCKTLVDVMDTNVVNILKNMIEGTESFQVSETLKGITFHIGNRLLHINKSTPRGIKTVDELAENYQYIASVDVPDLTSKVNKLYSIVNKCEIEVTLYEKRVELYYIGVDGSDSTIRLKAGVLDKDDVILDRFKIRLEFLKALLAIIGNEFDYYRGGDKICLKGSVIKLIVTTRT